jgi:hypothetical protein
MSAAPGSDSADELARIQEELHAGAVAELGRLDEIRRHLDELLVLYGRAKELQEQTPALNLDAVSLDAGVVQLLARSIYPAVRLCSMTLPAHCLEAGVEIQPGETRNGKDQPPTIAEGYAGKDPRWTGTGKARESAQTATRPRTPARKAYSPDRRY